MSSEAQRARISTHINSNRALSHIIVGALKLNSESGELADAIVKHICYDQPLDTDNIVEECGDLLWYIALILEYCNTDMSVCMEENIKKLKIRYPEKFTEEDAKERKDKI
jgi:NTP pyrophosphatase (non-canonical NTP hydrolase)